MLLWLYLPSYLYSVFGVGIFLFRASYVTFSHLQLKHNIIAIKAKLTMYCYILYTRNDIFKSNFFGKN